MIFSSKHKFMFFCNPKTATSSIESGLALYNEFPEFNQGYKGLYANKHIPPCIVKSICTQKIWNESFKFVFVRHPEDWVVSLIFYHHSLRYTRLSTLLKNIVKKPTSFSPLLREYKTAKLFLAKNVIEESDVTHIYKYLYQFRGMPFAPTLLQSNYVFDPDNLMLVSFVGRFENLEYDIGQIKENIGIDFPLPRLNMTNHKPYDEILTSSAKKLIRKLWCVDFENFGY